MRMALERAVQLAQIERRLGVTESVMRPCGVECGRRVSLGKDEAVAFGVVYRVRPEIQLGAEQAGQDVGAGQRAARMARARMIDRGDRVPAHEGGRLRELVFQVLRRGARRFLGDGPQGQGHWDSYAAARARLIRSV